MVTAQIREDILTGVLLQGERLRLVDLGARFGVSQSVVREALTRLTEQGLVQSEPQIGFRAMPISEADLNDLTAVRIEIQCLTVWQAVEGPSLDWEGSVVAARHVLSRTPQMSATDPARMSNEWAAAHRVCHQAILDGYASPRLRTIASGLRDAAALYQRWSRNLADDQTRDVAAEHQGTAGRRGGPRHRPGRRLHRCAHPADHRRAAAASAQREQGCRITADC